MAVGRVTVHHEGAGDPADTDRIASAGYTYGVGPAGFRRYRTVAQSFATIRFNHVSVDVCLTGDRRYHDVTDHDILSIGSAVSDARRRGEVIARPAVVPHRWSPGSATICPADRTMIVLGRITAVCQGVVTTPLPPHPNHPTLAAGAHGPAVAQLQHELNVGAGYHLADDGIFGHLTLLAVQAFQSFFRLDVDGIVGPKTWGLVDYCYALHGGH